jgi:hypothetical protein
LISPQKNTNIITQYFALFLLSRSDYPGEKGLMMINYKHLHYFWVIAKAGGIARASERLHLTSQTISGQLRALSNEE